jgi:hypothetical protein
LKEVKAAHSHYSLSHLVVAVALVEILDVQSRAVYVIHEIAEMSHSEIAEG